MKEAKFKLFEEEIKELIRKTIREEVGKELLKFEQKLLEYEHTQTRTNLAHTLKFDIKPMPRNYEVWCNTKEDTIE